MWIFFILAAALHILRLNVLCCRGLGRQGQSLCASNSVPNFNAWGILSLLFRRWFNSVASLALWQLPSLQRDFQLKLEWFAAKGEVSGTRFRPVSPVLSQKISGGEGFCLELKYLRVYLCVGNAFLQELSHRASSNFITQLWSHDWSNRITITSSWNVLLRLGSDTKTGEGALSSQQQLQKHESFSLEIRVVLKTSLLFTWSYMIEDLPFWQCDKTFEVTQIYN